MTMSKAAIRYQKRQPTPRDLRDELDAREMAAEMRAGLQSWAEYLMDTGRIYQ
ncbi:hypothetical protein LITTLEE_218 [Mycobacterium phage LittleE]|uniref:Uncharacterized protein n=5 Tax=Omegavirus TaxID=1623292 RepID=G1D4A2_9CAUD|nr:hypothetical protein AVT17_gp208 [Mycobacterium phage Ariel]YP_009637128.1 hypothetical protein FGG27_gp202 [Mycobacterium phage LittleE]AXQ52445.1 hypothetical protein SEA_ERICMILLARD_215 [Mycobacterium phage EricMillard]QED12363.1 hypothetical protein SEA_YEET_211 [Mycobacterium phage Yeet]QPO16809.1 hypothetical protein SEA_KASHFLOW_210 [Mycobacterium phage KashFlow]UEM46695.1 hypothetical protein SEA_JUICYJAY_212 [Mycobacterium phage JuicyJay]WNM72758.1 hypothetical protein SEA_BOMBITA